MSFGFSDYLWDLTQERSAANIVNIYRALPLDSPVLAPQAYPLLSHRPSRSQGVCIPAGTCDM